MNWRAKVLADIDALLEEHVALDKKQLRQDIWSLVCNATGDYVQQYRNDILNPRHARPSSHA